MTSPETRTACSRQYTALPTSQPPRPKQASAPMKAATWFTADRVSAKRSNIAAPSRQGHCRAAAGAYATNGFSFGGAGNPLACGPRAEHPQPEVHGAQIIHFLLQIRRGERMLLEPARRKAHFQRARRRRQIERGERGGAAAAVQQHRGRS